MGRMVLAERFVALHMLHTLSESKDASQTMLILNSHTIAWGNRLSLIFR